MYRGCTFTFTKSSSPNDRQPDPVPSTNALGRGAGSSAIARTTNTIIVKNQPTPKKLLGTMRFSFRSLSSAAHQGTLQSDMMTLANPGDKAAGSLISRADERSRPSSPKTHLHYESIRDILPQDNWTSLLNERPDAVRSVRV